MPEIGQTISHYRIVEKIGEGGMGEVYLANDTTLDRKVALKFLPEAFTSDPERMARFEREAKLLASLNHPNIAGIYGLEQADSNRFLVLEYVEGETLQARLSKGSLPLEDALALCRQVAEGLEAAHEKGVIHRDLKPANLMITADEKVKILDFGLAKAFSDDTQSIDSSQSPTLTEAMTRPGVILGTAAYMSPEQAKGKSVDKRADIWAFGCILYECLTGKRAFEGETVTETLAAILRGEPEWNSLPPNIHPRIRLLLERCLEKHSKDRYGSISDARVDILKALEDPGGVFVRPVTTDATQRRMRTMLPWIAAIIIIGVAVWILKPSPPPEPKQVMRFYYELPHDQDFSRTGELLTAVSADGTKIVYVSNQQLYLRELDELDAIPIMGTDEDPANPFFSPDGNWVGYYSFADNQWKKIATSGGTSVKLCDAPDPNGASWGTDGTILFAQKNGAIMRVSEDGGTAEPLIKTEEGGDVYGPQGLPGGEWVLFTFSTAVGRNWDKAQIVVQSLKTDERKILIPEGSDARYLPTGHIVYALGNDLLAFAFDTEKMERRGGPVAIVQGVQRAALGVTGAAQYSFSDTGILAHIVGGKDAFPRRRLVWMDREGKEEPIAAPPGFYFNPRISPDGKRIALRNINDSGDSDIHIWNLDNGIMTQLTFDKIDDYMPLWTPDGKGIIFESEREDRGIYWKSADGTGVIRNLFSGSIKVFMPFSWSGDGNSLIFAGDTGGIDSIDIGSLSMDDDYKMTPLLIEDYDETQPQISPNGKWMAYTSNKSDKFEIYVQPYPNLTEGYWQISKDGGESPLWSPDGKELFYLSSKGAMAVSVKEEPTFETINYELLFEGNYRNLMQGFPHPWDIDPNTKRFLMAKPVLETEEASEVGTPRKINIVLNFFEELKQKVPVP